MKNLKAAALFASLLFAASCSYGNADATPRRAEKQTEEANIPPKITEISGNAEALVGQKVSLEARIAKTDDDDFSVSWSQVKNPDRYFGTDFLSSSSVSLEQTGNLASFTPMWPGKYRLQVKASDKDGESSAAIDVLARFEKAPFEIKGVALNIFGSEYQNDLAFGIPNIDRAKGLGANFIQLIPAYYQMTPRDNEMLPCERLSPGRWCTPFPDETLRRWIRHAKSLGMGVMLKLIVDTADQDNTGHSKINPANPEIWFSNYQKFVVKYAEMAQQEKVEWISIGNELSQLQARPQLRQIISHVRNVYEGKLTYSDNRILLRDRRNYAQFWDLLDAVSINAFYEGSDKDTNPTVDNMHNYILAQMRAELAKEAARFGKGIIATELGKPGYDGTNFDFTTTRGRIPDSQEQADWLDAMLRAFYTLKNDGFDMNGMFMWNMHNRKISSSAGTGTRDFRGQPAEELIGLWYSQK